MKQMRLPAALALLLGTGALAQGPQNLDFALMFGPARVKPYTVASTLEVSGATGLAFVQSTGYQIRRTSAGSLWLEITPTAFFSPGASKTSNGQSVYYTSLAFTAGVRFMLPLHARFSLYGRLGGGVGSFTHTDLVDGAFPYIRTNSTWRGLADLGGGVNFRLNTRLSLRGELRDFITSPGLSGVSGRHHVVPMLGIAMHF